MTDEGVAVNEEEAGRLGAGEESSSAAVGFLCRVDDATVLASHSRNAPPTIPAIQANCFTESAFFLERLGATGLGAADESGGGDA